MSDEQVKPANVPLLAPGELFGVFIAAATLLYVAVVTPAGLLSPVMLLSVAGCVTLATLRLTASKLTKAGGYDALADRMADWGGWYRTPLGLAKLTVLAVNLTGVPLLFNQTAQWARNSYRTSPDPIFLGHLVLHAAMLGSMLWVVVKILAPYLEAYKIYKRRGY